MTKTAQTHLVIPDPHAHPEYSNERADWLGQLIVDIKPDVVVNIGDTWDMPSMCGYDKGTKSFHGRSYQADIEAGIEFNDRLFHPLKKQKKRLPHRVFLEGNHEQRLKRAIELQPELEGEQYGIHFSDYQLDRYYDTVVEYSGQTPGIIELDGIFYAHYFISGVMGRPISSEHTAHALVSKLGRSATCGHIHTFDYSVRTTVDGGRNIGCVAGVYQDYHAGWAGSANNLWWRGVVVKTNVNNGIYDINQISLNTLRKEYGSREG